MGSYSKPSFDGHKSNFIRDYLIVALSLVVVYFVIIVIVFNVVKKTAPPAKPRDNKSKKSSKKEEDSNLKELKSLDGPVTK